MNGEIFNNKSYEEDGIYECYFNNTSTTHLRDGFIMAFLMEHINISYIWEAESQNLYFLFKPHE